MKIYRVHLLDGRITYISARTKDEAESLSKAAFSNFKKLEEMK